MNPTTEKTRSPTTFPRPSIIIRPRSSDEVSCSFDLTDAAVVACAWRAVLLVHKLFAIHDDDEQLARALCTACKDWLIEEGLALHYTSGFELDLD